MKKAPFNISIESDYKELWRYNLALIGEVAVAGERVDVVRHLDEVASVGLLDTVRALLLAEAGGIAGQCLGLCDMVYVRIIALVIV